MPVQRLQGLCSQGSRFQVIPSQRIGSHYTGPPGIGDHCQTGARRSRLLGHEFRTVEQISNGVYPYDSRPFEGGVVYRIFSCHCPGV